MIQRETKIFSDIFEHSLYGNAKKKVAYNERITSKSSMKNWSCFCRHYFADIEFGQYYVFTLIDVHTHLFLCIVDTMYPNSFQIFLFNRYIIFSAWILSLLCIWASNEFVFTREWFHLFHGKHAPNNKSKISDYKSKVVSNAYHRPNSKYRRNKNMIGEIFVDDISVFTMSYDHNKLRYTFKMR